MYCSECGKEMPGNAVFCPECGARQNGEGLSETAAGSAAAAGIPSQEQKKAKKHRRIGKAVVGLIVIAVGIVGWNIRGMWQERELSTVIKYQDLYCLGLEDWIIYDRNGNSYGNNVLPVNYFFNMDGTIMAYVSDGELYYLKDSETYVVDQDVELEFPFLKFSSSGEDFVYIKRVKAPDQNEKAVLCMYNLKDDELEIIEEIEENVEIGDFLLSSNGEIVAYNIESGDDEKNTLYIKKKGKEPVKVAKNGAIPLLIGEEKLLYEKNGKLYLYDGKESSKIASLEEEKFEGGCSNIDGTELLYSDGGNIYFLNLKTEENRKIVSGSLEELAGLSERRFAFDLDGIYGRYVYVCGLKTFCNKAFSTDAGGVYLLNRKGEANRLPSLTGSASGGSTYLFSDDWKQYVYLNGSSLFLVKNIEDGKAEQLTEDEVKYVTCSGDLKEIYYVTEDDELYYLNRGKPVLLSDDVKDEEDAVAVRYSERFGGVCFIEDDDLYFAGKSDRSRELLYEDVESLSSYYAGNSFYTEEETESGSSTYKSSTYWMADKDTFIKMW